MIAIKLSVSSIIVIFTSYIRRRRNRREGKTHKKGKMKNTNRKGKQKQKYK